MQLEPSSATMLADIDRAVRGKHAYAAELFEALRAGSQDVRGVTRASFMEGEQAAHDLMASQARSLGMEVSVDAVGNLIMRMAGTNPSLPAWITGSHLDSVHEGGNFDGAAGVVAGIVACAAMREAGYRPARDLLVMGFRAEECSTWFVGKHGGHLGSRAVLGLLDPKELDTATHIRTGRTFAQMVDDAGFNSARLRDPVPVLPAASVAGYVELHIEQGPVLEHKGLPAGIVTSIRGCHRARNACARGEYSHSGGVPHELRRDAVMAVAELVTRMDEEWTRRRAQGDDMVLTFGKFATEAALHSIVKVPGRVDFAVDIRSQDESTLLEVEALMLRLAEEIGARRRVRIDLGAIDRVRPARMDAALQAELARDAQALQVPVMSIASGGGHDAADFHDVGVPTAMIFVRNDHGSHNAEESMEIPDFMEATRLLACMLARKTSEELA